MKALDDIIKQSDEKTIEVISKQSDEKTRRANIPTNTHVEDWIKDFLEKLEIPAVLDNSDLIDLGNKMLREKIKYIEEKNMVSGSAGKQKVPNKLEFDDVAVVLMSLFTFKKIQTTGKRENAIFAVYVDMVDSPKFGTYSTDIQYMYEIMEPLAPKFKNRDMDDVIDKIKRSVETVELTTDPKLFAVKNGIYNQKTRELLPYTSDYAFMAKIPVDYVENPVNPHIRMHDGKYWDVDSWILDLMDGDDELNTLIWQVIADCLQPNYSRNKSIWFYSERGNNGKGTLGKLIKEILGRGNYASLSVADFSHEFLKYNLIGAAANISDENDVGVYIDSAKDYKASVTGDDININIKNKNPITMRFYGTNIQMLNGLPQMKDKSESFYRRIILVPFLRSFTNNGERSYIKDDYTERVDVLEYVLHKALNIEFEEYIQPRATVELMGDYKQLNDPVLEFWNELRDEFAWDLLPAAFLYELFKKWLVQNNPSGKAMKSSQFKNRLREIIHDDPEWMAPDTRTMTVSTGNRMDADEPLISEYGLDMRNPDGSFTKWVDPSYKSGDPVKKRDFNRSSSYSGIVRL